MGAQWKERDLALYISGILRTGWNCSGRAQGLRNGHKRGENAEGVHWQKASRGSYPRGPSSAGYRD